MTGPQTTLQLSRVHENRQLFSNWFLDERLRRDPIWSEVTEAADRVRDELRHRWSAERHALGRANEAQTEARWIRPVLESLGWGFEVQPGTRHQGSKLVPDYALFASAETARATASAVAEPRAIYRQAIAVLEAKRWARALDAAGRDDERVPSAQVINYLVRTDQRWGVLTNGLDWRLYCRDVDFPDSVYFAVDLPALLGDEALPIGASNELIPASEAFRYFYLFFRPASFTPGLDGIRWLDVARGSSTRYARGVEEALKPRAYRAVTALVRGFAAAAGMAPREVARDPATARLVLDNSLTLLFRLLFVLYAEARDLLPVRTNAAYRAKSLLALRERVRDARDGNATLFPLGRDLWNDLHDLFRIVDGAPEWRLADIPVYNGGLFDPAKHEWLESHYVADPFLAEALDLLSRVEDPDDHRMHLVDYTPLDVRHLGSIYEGLLEYTVRAATEPLPPIRERRQVVRDAVAEGQLYLATDKGERRISGSFYTPDYIVQYLVDRALGPLVDGRTPDEILALRVLDPAMGSGHFLVAVTAYLTRAVVRASDHSDQARLDLGALDPDHLRRLVVERCVFGVDKNPRAVELAKLALWLATVQHGKALNFLDHHLKCGDALLGTRAGEMSRFPARRSREAQQEIGGQYGAFDTVMHQRLLQAQADLEAIRLYLSDTAEQVAAKEQLYAHASGVVQRLRDVGDLWAAAWFPEPEPETDGEAHDAWRARRLDADRYARAIAALGSDAAAWTALRAEPWFARALVLAAEHRFFHWEVEFVEAFFDAAGDDLPNPGFHAVVGNPPYVRMEAFRPIKDFLRGRYRTYESRADLYVYFMERSLELLRRDGQYAVILSNKFLRANYGGPVRALFGGEASVREIVDLGGLPVFPEATVRAALFTAVRGSDHQHDVLWGKPRVLEERRFAASVGESLITLPATFVRGEGWELSAPEVHTMMARIAAECTTLGEALPRQIYRGIVTGLNQAFVIDAARRDALVADDPRSAELIKPLVTGDAIRRYHLDRDDNYLIYVKRGCAINQYPAVLRHLMQYRGQLEARATADSHEWYELQQPQEAYVAAFESDKLLYPDIGKSVRFVIATGVLYPTNTCFLIPVRDWSILGILNSSLSEFMLRHISAALEGGGSAYLRFFAQSMERIPVPVITESTPAPQRAELGLWLNTLYAHGLRLAGIEPEVPDDIRELGRRLASMDSVREVSLVGSWARGQARDDSDVDLLVIADDDGTFVARRRAILDQLGETSRVVDPHVYSPSDVAADTDGLLRRLRGERVVLYER